MIRTAPAAVVAAAALAACGDARDLHGRLGVPEPREARVTLSPALDVTSLVDADLADRIAIDEIVVNVSDVRLVGTDPRLPAGGYELLGQDRQLSTIELDDAGRFPFPSWMLDDELSVYVRINRSEALDGASVIVRARLFEQAVNSTMQSLRASGSAPNPDGEPAHGGDEAPNPDGEPAHEGEAPNPDGEPAGGCDPSTASSDLMTECSGASRRGLMHDGVIGSQALAFELRGMDVVDLVVGFDRDSRMNVVLGIRAGLWFTPEVVTRLEKELEVRAREASAPGGAKQQRPVVVEQSAKAKIESNGQNDGMRSEQDDDYRLVEDGSLDPNFRKH